jgi:hypothetical protein
MNVKIIEEGVHSGDASGVVPDTMRIIRQVPLDISITSKILKRLEDTKTGDLHPDLQVHIPSDHYSAAEVYTLIFMKWLESHWHYWSRSIQEVHLGGRRSFHSL